MLAQLSTIFGYVAGAVIFIATIFMLRAILSGPNEKKSDSDGDD
ncbi:hypothetical protein [Magnetovibrio sp.]